VRAQIQAGRLSALGIASLKRSPFMPDIPTFAEQGYPGFEAVGWIGLAAPAGTPDAILDRLNAELVKMAGEPAVKDKFETLAFVPAVGTRQEFAAFIRSEITKWTKVAKDAGVKLE
jgi:tripartite-type tricarboxylate transporter receptor subunit TctC